MASIRKRRDKWQVQIRRQGSPALSKSFNQKKDAEAWSRLMEVQADRLDLPQDPRLLEGYSVGDIIVRYLANITPRKRGAQAERIALTALLRHPICQLRLSDVTCLDFAAYRDERLKAVKVSTLKRMLSTLHNMFEIARTEWGLPLKENPLASVRLICPSNRRERRLRDGELQRIIVAAGKTRNQLILPIILFAVETGLRRSEILAATWNHLDLGNRVLSVPRAKNGHPRSIPLTKTAISILGHLETNSADEARVFPTTANALRLSWERLLRRATIKDLNFHDLRHEAISRFFEMGLPGCRLESKHVTALGRRRRMIGRGQLSLSDIRRTSEACAAGDLLRLTAYDLP